MEDLKKVILIASNVLDLLLGKDLPGPATAVFTKYLYRW